MRVSTRQYAQALLTLGEGLDGVHAHVVAKRFSAWISRRGESARLEHILREADRLSCEQEGRVEVSVVTPRPIDVSKTSRSDFSGKKDSGEIQPRWNPDRWHDPAKRRSLVWCVVVYSDETIASDSGWLRKILLFLSTFHIQYSKIILKVYVESTHRRTKKAD